MNNYNFREIQILYQLISLGLHESAYSLSLILGKVIKIKQPYFESLSSLKVGDLIKEKHKSNSFVTVSFDEKFSSDAVNTEKRVFPGQIMFSITKEQSKEIAYMYASDRTVDDEVIESANKEIGNTLCAAILNTMADKLAITLNPSIPQMHHNLEDLGVEKLLNIEKGTDETNSIVVKSAFIDKEKEIEMSIFILFYDNTYKDLIKLVKSMN